jgi:hypothetical protein
MVNKFQCEGRGDEWVSKDGTLQRRTSSIVYGPNESVRLSKCLP